MRTTSRAPPPSGGRAASPPGLTEETASGALTALSTLARRAHDRGHRLYCWWSL
ncbi:hypothetical protein OHN99_06205 [Streptomyces jietaisiensis]|uniref:hypothetical protein n=1 Tax=Streptomyces griseoaurantiacus TaxID=68213 RepID=UPI002E288D89|nr:hypothetical protein [Streptomyces jietaisiensis]